MEKKHSVSAKAGKAAEKPGTEDSVATDPMLDIKEDYTKK
jgi:hypothetical protein